MSDGAGKTTMPGREILGKRRFLDRDFSVVTYDFRRPDKFAKDQIVTLEIIHETFARLAEVKLSTLMKTRCDASVAIVDQLTFGEFIEGLEGPSPFAIISLKPFPGPALVRLDRGLAIAILESLFGADSVDAIASATASAPAGFTDIECATLEHAIGKLLPDIAAAWEQIERLEPRLSSLETDPRFCQIVPPTEMIVLVGIDAKIGEFHGRLELVFPFLAIEPILHKLYAKYWYDSASTPGDLPASKESPAYAIKLPLHLVFEGRPLAIGDLRSLRNGSLLPLPGLDRGEASLKSGDRLIQRFRLEDKTTAGSFILTTHSDSGASKDFAPSNEDKGAEGLRQAMAGLERNMGELGERLAAFEGRQEAFADRLLFGQSDSASTGAKGEGRPFAALASVPSEAFALFLAGERPQFAALVLAWLDDAIAAAILDAMPEALRTESLRRLVSMVSARPEVLAVTEGVLAKKFASRQSERSAPDGLRKVVGILNLSRRATERQVIEGLEALDPALAEQIKKNMFVFEDISLLDGETIAILLERAEESDLILALKPLDAVTRGKVLARFERGAAARILAKVEAMGRVRLSECDAAGQRIVEAVRKIDEEGLMGLIMPGEEI